MTAATQLINSTQPPNLRPLESHRDLLAVADLIELCFAERLDADGHRYIRQMRAAAKNRLTLGIAGRVSPSLIGYVWDEGGRIVGNLSLLPIFAVGRRSYLIANVAVHPDYRRRGIANSLTEAALQYARKRGASSVWLQVNQENPGAIHLYQSFGFVERARRTTWHSVYAPEEADRPSDIFIATRKAGDWDRQQEWLNWVYPEEVRWHLPIKPRMLKPGLLGIFNRLFNEKHFYQWSAYQGGQLIGTVSWQSSYSQADWLWLASSPRHQEAAVQGLLPHARKSLPQHRLLAVNYPAGEAAQTFESAGFHSHLTLKWMHMDVR